MAINILYKGSQVLKEISKQIEITANTHQLIENLKEAIRFKDKVWTHTGLAICGIQIGVPERVIIVGRPLYWTAQRHHSAFDVIINPKIAWQSETQLEDWEGCLSIPDSECLIKRPSEIKLKYLNLAGKSCEKHMKGTLARVIQHEIDHLNGKLMTDISLSTRPKSR